MVGAMVGEESKQRCCRAKFGGCPVQRTHRDAGPASITHLVHEPPAMEPVEFIRTRNLCEAHRPIIRLVSKDIWIAFW